MKSNSRTSYHLLFNTDAVFVIIEGKRNSIFVSGGGDEINDTAYKCLGGGGLILINDLLDV